ncbi:hypothetical protein [Alienimonas californiensis]|uniref:Uncharacterized protein n=1 Tax=Alienimonas californiensis TaxID=2527989 RepID=A0A517PBV0_9PLAN|nr:hypothetical protein [Alienimonas californiensis]QDT16829.1 hypothetical protein CA12_29360 [Alienimonas californiensis]
MDALSQVLDAVFQRIQNHWIELLTAAAFTLVGWFLGHRRAKSNWRKREFFDRVNFSLNSLAPAEKQADGQPGPRTLRIRTLAEMNAGDVFLNAAARDAVTASARRTTAADPTLPLPQEDYWFYLNAVLNELSERFAAGLLRRDLGQQVRGEIYLVSLTCEAAGAMRQRKVRAMVIRKDLLLDLPEGEPTYEAPTHTTRWETLRFLAAEYGRNPWKFLEVELCL